MFEFVFPPDRCFVPSTPVALFPFLRVAGDGWTLPCISLTALFVCHVHFYICYGFLEFRLKRHFFLRPMPLCIVLFVLVNFIRDTYRPFAFILLAPRL